MTQHEAVDGENVYTGGVWEIDHGWDVIGADGEKVGEVHEVAPHYVVVSKGFFFPTERFVPVSAIANVERDTVYLRVPKDQIDSMGWDVVPEEVDPVVATHAAGVGGYTGAPATVTDDLLADDEAGQAVTGQRVGWSDAGDEPERHQGFLQPQGRPRTTNATLQEDVVIERRPIAGSGDMPAVPADSFQEMDIDIPLRGETTGVPERVDVRDSGDPRRPAG